MSIDQGKSSPPETPAFVALPDLIRKQAHLRPEHPALVMGDEVLSYRALIDAVDQHAAALQRDGVKPGDAVALIAKTSIAYCVAFFGAIRAGATAVPISPSSTTTTLATTITDADPSHIFVDADTITRFGDIPEFGNRRLLAIDGTQCTVSLDDWLAEGGEAGAAAICAELPFNIIYSSGTTGTPKGIVQSHGMRQMHIARGRMVGYGTDSVALLSTPLYSNTTLIALLPTLALGGTAVLMERFDAGAFLELSERHRVTHAALVPVQYRRILDHADFDRRDLKSYRMKTSTGAPFAVPDKAEVLRRWAGGLIEIYGMTEGGGTTTLAAHLHPDKLHTVGRPVDGHEFCIVDGEGALLDLRSTGEIVGRSPGMMTRYHRQPDKTREAEWFDAAGRRFIRTGDIGRFDEDGFLILSDRKKDLIISGGFNIYPSDLETELRLHADINDAAVIGVPSLRWGETPVAFVVAAIGTSETPVTMRDWVAARLSATQRIHEIVFVRDLPRSPLGKVLKRDLRDLYEARNTPA